jgi:hypothetical protein
VGVGVSDSHGGSWSEDPNNFVSWVWAPAPERAALVEGLRRGRVFFGDLSRFDGSLDLRTARGAAMGQIVVTERDSEELQVEAGGLVPGDVLVVVIAGEPVARHVADGEALRVTHALALPRGEDTFARVELRDAQGGPRAFSNPIHFVRSARAGELPAARVMRDASEPAP